MKKTLKRVAAFLIAGVMLLGAHSVFADFTDMPQDETKAALENAVTNGLLTGYDNGEIRPYGNITRAEMGAIIARAMNASKKADISKFEDVNASQWYYDTMSKSVAMGAFQGSGTTLNPETNITFQEAFVVLSRIFYLRDSIVTRDPDTKKEVVDLTVLDQYADKDQIADWAKEGVAAVVAGGYWTGENGLLKPTEYINRAQFAVVMNNLIQVYINEAGTYDGAALAAGNIMVRANDVVLNNLNGRDIYIGDGVSGKIDLTAEQGGRVVARGGNIKLTGTYQYLRMLMEGVVSDIADGDVSVGIYGVEGTTVSLGMQTVQ